MIFDIPDDDKAAKSVFRTAESCLEHMRVVRFGTASAKYNIEDPLKGVEYTVSIRISYSKLMPPPPTPPPPPKDPLLMRVIDWFIDLPDAIRTRWKARRT